MFHDLRRELLVENEMHSHDWASLVIYEALPPDLEEKLERYRYHQAKDALKAAEKCLQHVVARAQPDSAGESPRANELKARITEARARCKKARESLPTEGAYALESLGLRASNLKTCAEASFDLSKLPGRRKEARQKDLIQCHRELEEAFDEYSRAVEGFLGHREERPQREASLHWVVVQMLSMGTVLGRKMNRDHWAVGRCSATAYLLLPDTDERAWAKGSLAELLLLRLANEKLTNKEIEDIRNDAVSQVKALVDLYHERGTKQVESTERQFRRYVEWWGDKKFEEYLMSQGVLREQDWTKNRVLDTAEQLRETLEKHLWKND